MRVLVLTSWYPNKTNKIYGVFVKEQVLAMAKQQLEVAVFYPFDVELKARKIVSRYEQGVKTYRANTIFFQNRNIWRIVGGFNATLKLLKVLKEFKPDIIHVHVGFPAAIVAYLASRFYPVPYVITEHMSYFQYYVNMRSIGSLLKRAFEKAAYVFPVSSFLEGQLKSFGWKLNLVSLPNVVDTDRFVFQEQPPHPVRNILFVGSMDDREIKGVQYLLPAFAEVLRTMTGSTGTGSTITASRMTGSTVTGSTVTGSPMTGSTVTGTTVTDRRALHLHLIGDGPKRSSYEKLAGELGISGQCTFHGWVNPNQMPDFFAKADLLVSSSLRETFGVVLIEAMACGKPVVATACGGPRDIITKETGLLVEPGNVSALAKGLRTVIENYAHYDPALIRQYAVEHYSPAVIARQLKEIYQKSI